MNFSCELVIVTTILLFFYFLKIGMIREFSYLLHFEEHFKRNFF